LKYDIVRSPFVDTDIAGLADFIARHNYDAGLRFFDAVEQTFDVLSEMPTLGSLYEFPDAAVSDLRAWPVKGFPNHIIFYRIVGERVEIVRVLRGARNLPGILRRSLRE
jgi:toxin ParE1/3/4